MNLYLIGLRGCGKSTVAPLVAELMGWQHADTDRQVEVLTGCSIADIFAHEGEAGFRQWETSVLQAYAQKGAYVLSLGGGAPIVTENRILMRETGRTVWLTAPTEILWQRILADPTSHHRRPNLTALTGLDEVCLLAENRAPLYAKCADYTIDTSSKSAEDVAQAIVNWFDPVDT